MTKMTTDADWEDTNPQPATTPHKCPVCLGTKQVQWPPGSSSNGYMVQMMTTSCGPWPCEVCNATGIVWR